MVKFTPWPIYHYERTPDSIEERTDWAPEAFGNFWRCEKSLTPTGVSYNDRDM